MSAKHGEIGEKEGKGVERRTSASAEEGRTGSNVPCVRVGCTSLWRQQQTSRSTNKATGTTGAPAVCANVSMPAAGVRKKSRWASGMTTKLRRGTRQGCKLFR